MLTACASVVVDVPGLNEQQKIWLAGIVIPERAVGVRRLFIKRGRHRAGASYLWQ